MLAGIAFADSNDFFTDMYDYSRVFAAIGLFAVGGYSAYKYMLTEDQLAKKDALETFIYALVGATIVLMAPMISEVLVP
jgi:hypothetical protein